MAKTDTPTLATSYHEGYVDGIKMALEFCEYADSLDALKESFSRMIENLNTKKEN